VKTDSTKRQGSPSEKRGKKQTLDRFGVKLDRIEGYQLRKGRTIPRVKRKKKNTY